MFIALVSLDQHWQDKDANFFNCVEFVQQAHKYNCDLIVFPEMTLTGYSLDVDTLAEPEKDSPTLLRFGQLAKKYGLSIIFGACLINPLTNRSRNQFCIAHEDGSSFPIYAKVHPFSFSDEHKVIEVKNEQDSTIIDIILPYKTQLDKEMNQIICYTKSELKKGKPESKLGNFVCDLSLLRADGMADICIFNNGGLRNIIASGNITVRDIYKVMPFENELVILDLNKKEYYDLLKYVANSGGEPLGGVNIIAKKDTIVTAFNSNEIIRVLTTDYLANGGDNMKFFINKEQKKIGIKLRDAIINYCIQKDTIDIQIDNRLIFEYGE